MEYENTAPEKEGKVNIYSALSGDSKEESMRIEPKLERYLSTGAMKQ